MDISRGNFQSQKVTTEQIFKFSFSRARPATGRAARFGARRSHHEQGPSQNVDMYVKCDMYVVRGMYLMSGAGGDWQGMCIGTVRNGSGRIVSIHMYIVVQAIGS